MAKVTIIGATGNVGTFAAHAISAIPHVNQILLYGREGRESLLKGITQDLGDSFAARGTDIRVTWTTRLDDVGRIRRSGDHCRHAAHTRDRTVWISQWAMHRSLHPLREDWRIAPETKILVVTNPVDVMTSVALKYSQSEDQPGIRPWDAPRLNATQVAHCRVFPCPCERSPYPCHR